MFLRTNRQKMTHTVSESVSDSYSILVDN